MIDRPGVFAPITSSHSTHPRAFHKYLTALFQRGGGLAEPKVAKLMYIGTFQLALNPLCARIDKYLAGHQTCVLSDKSRLTWHISCVESEPYYQGVTSCIVKD